MRNFLFLFICIGFFGPCHSQNFEELLLDSPVIKGKDAYLASPFVTAGNRLYVVGHQDGSFPEIGWHIKGEMGGVWSHPIKLLDGFEVEISYEGHSEKLLEADDFFNYPIAAKHIYNTGNSSLRVERWQFVPDNLAGLVVQYVFKNKDEKSKKINFTLKTYSDLRPTWLGERTNMIDSEDIFEEDEKGNLLVFKDNDNPWFSIVASNRSSNGTKAISNPYQGKGRAISTDYSLEVPANGSTQINFYISGSNQSKAEAENIIALLKSDWKEMLISKKVRFENLAMRSKLSIPNKDLEQAFEWLKYNSDWLIQSVPGIGTGITAGIPDYPWWFGVDSEYALQGYMAIGQTEPVFQTISLLDSVSQKVNGNGKIIHEMSTNGAVFNDGNINETPQFASLIWEIYQWDGDRNFLQKYFPTIQKGLSWLMLENDENKNLFPDGFGMMEIHGMDNEMIDVAVYTQKAFRDAANIATELELDSLSAEYRDIANKLKEKINNEFWSQEFGSYADFIGTDAQAIRLLEDAIVRADTLNKPWSVKELKETKKYILEHPSNKPSPFVLHHNWVVNTPMETKVADPEKAKTALKTAETYTNPFGVFVTGIDRDESFKSDLSGFKGSKMFSYTGAVMTLPTGVQAIAENNYGNPDMALEYLKRMTRSFSYALPGSIYEVSPDYGMITQAWNIYSFAIPIVEQFFGIQPNAAKKIVSIQPQMPSAWNKASLENVLMKDNEVSVYYEKNDNIMSLKILKTNVSWIVEFTVPENYKLLSTNIGTDLNQENKELRSDKNLILLELEEIIN
ncbi:glycogen debranching protein [Gramella sp. AN32]|uniref:Glycogen debranching protein n=1 Tax=Christiangramia antarctica TaxID=2058158 RepID=A0ABW5X5M6_9FLAO|nr:glycogen debranching protein [Gramella sp. AN32]MCM4158028.1 glycogen debranching protein [Gramella sp. AN32]